MSQEVKIPVTTQAQGAVDGIKQIDKALDKSSESADKLAKKTKEVADNLAKMEVVAKRLQQTQDILNRFHGKAIDKADVEVFLRNFERMRTGRTLGAQSVRNFNSFPDWMGGVGSLYTNPAAAARAIRTVMAVGMQGTGFAAGNPVVLPGAAARARPAGGMPGALVDEMEGGGGLRALGGWAGRGVMGAMPGWANSAVEGAGIGRAAMGGLSGMATGGAIGLGMSAVTALIGMITGGINSANARSISLDVLNRRLGGGAETYDKLQDSIKDTAAMRRNLGISYDEAIGYGSSYASAAGSGLAPGSIAGGVANAVGFSKGFGFDPSVGAGLFGTAAGLGITKDDQSQKKFAMLLAEAINKSGYLAKADEFMQLVTNFGTQMFRSTLQAPNMTGYAAELAGLMSSSGGRLDPAGAAGLFGMADSAFKRGGAFGQASMSAIFSALGGTGIRNPYMIEALMGGGLTASTHSTFFDKNSELYGTAGPGVVDSEETNLDRLKGWFKQHYPDDPEMGGSARWEAMANTLGLSIPQSKFLERTSPEDLSAGMKLAEHAHIHWGNLNAGGMANITSLADAGSMGQLNALYESALASTDLSDTDAQHLKDVQARGNFTEMKDVLANFYADHGREQTPGSEAEQNQKDMEKAIENLGELLAGPLNAIQREVEKIAEFFGYEPPVTNLSGADSADPRGVGTKSGMGWVTSYVSPPVIGSDGKVVQPAGAFHFTEEQENTIRKYATDKDEEVFHHKILMTENRGKGQIDNTAQNKKTKAFGAYQFWPQTWAGLTDQPLSQAADFDYSTQMAHKLYRQLVGTWGKDPDVLAAAWDGGTKGATGVKNGQPRGSMVKELRDYLNYYDQIGNTPIPNGHPLTSVGPHGAVHVHVTGEVALNQDGKVHKVPLRQHSPSPPAGADPDQIFPAGLLP